MGWLSLKEFPGDTFYAVLDEIESASPRATAIVAASFVEDHLRRLLLSRLVDDAKAIERALGSNGPLGTFSAKINFGYLMGIYTAAACREMDTIRGIRNDFAHEMNISSFDVQSVKDRVATLTAWEREKISIRKANDYDVSKKLELYVRTSVPDDEQEIPLTPAEETSTTQGRYVAACRFYIGFFALLINFFPRRPSPPEFP